MESFGLAVKGIKKLLSRGVHTEVRYTMTHPTPDIKELLDFFYKFNFCNIVLGLEKLIMLFDD